MASKAVQMSKGSEPGPKSSGRHKMTCPYTGEEMTTTEYQFVLAYKGDKKDAAKEIGISLVSAWQMMRRPHVQRAIQAYWERELAGLAAKKEERAMQLTMIVRTGMREAIVEQEVDEIDELLGTPTGNKIKQQIMTMVPVSETTLMQAHNLLAKMSGDITDKVEHKVEMSHEEALDALDDSKAKK